MHRRNILRLRETIFPHSLGNSLKSLTDWRSIYEKGVETSCYRYAHSGYVFLPFCLGLCCGTCRHRRHVFHGSAEMESVTRAGNSWVGLLTSEVQIGSGTFLGRDISCYNHNSSPGAVQFRIAGRSPIGVVPGGGCQFQDVWGFKEIFAAPISGYGTYTLSWTD